MIQEDGIAKVNNLSKIFDELELLSSEFPQLDYPCNWGYMFHPECFLDEEWITDNTEGVEECGFLLYYSEETGILLGVDGAGYDFYSSHWIPLYKRRGLRWHDEEVAAEEVSTASS